MRIVITGANSAVGRAILRLASPSLVLVAAVRSARAIDDLPEQARAGAVRISYDDSSSLHAAFAGADAVIHLAGTLVERPDSSYEMANVETTRAVAAAAVRCGVRKLVFVSANGADAASPNRYWKSKGDAEVVVRASGCEHTILRAPLLLGPGTEGTAALQRHLSKPTVVLPGGGRHLQQPLHVDDLARASLSAAASGVAKNATLELVGPALLPDRDLLIRGAKALGRPLRIRSLPLSPLRLWLSLRRRFGARTGFSPDVLEVITTHLQMDPLPAAVALGIQLTGVDEMISESVNAPAKRRA